MAGGVREQSLYSEGRGDLRSRGSSDGEGESGGLIDDCLYERASRRAGWAVIEDLIVSLL